MANQVAQAEPKAQTPMQRFNSAISSASMKTYLTDMLGDKRDSFVNNVVALVSNNTALQACKPMSIVYAGMKATALDLPLDANLGFAYVIPYNNKDGAVAQFQIGFKGIVQLALRSGQFKAINVTDIRDGEMQGRNILTGDIQFSEVPNRLERPVVGYAAYFALNNGFSKTLYMTVEELNHHGQRFSKTYNNANGLWKNDFDAMAKKTVLKALLSKWAPLSVEMKEAIRFDQAEITENNTPVYVDRVEDADEQNFEAQAQMVEEKRQAMRSAETMADTML